MVSCLGNRNVYSKSKFGTIKINVATGGRLMENLMKQYLGNQYDKNPLINFCNYWMRLSEGRGDSFRKSHDMDCIYFDGDLRADTLISPWTPVKWVVDYFNAEYDLHVVKRAKDHDDVNYYIKLLRDDCHAYLPPNHLLTKLLYELLELCEERCNYILLPKREMNCDRYALYENGEKKWLYDFVPATLYHIFEPDTLGKYFDEELSAKEWVERECLQMGFVDNVISQDCVYPLIKGLHPKDGKWLVEEDEIQQALQYMIRLLRCRLVALDERER